MSARLDLLVILVLVILLLVVLALVLATKIPGV